MWGDHYIPQHNERGRSHPGGRVWYDYPSTAGARGLVARATGSRPITITNWSWSYGEETDLILRDAGFKVVWGNFDGRAMHPEFARRARHPWILGAATSSWCAADEFELGKMHAAAALYGEELLWGTDKRPEELDRAVAEALPGVKSALMARPLSSQSARKDERLSPIAIRGNSPLRGAGWELSALAGAHGVVGRVPYRIGKRCLAVRRPDGKGRYPAGAGIRVRGSWQGLVFWHATTGPGGRSVHAGDGTHFPRDSSDLLAVYEVVFADGLTESVQCRYAESINAWDAPAAAALYHAPHHLLWRGRPGGPLLAVCGHEWRNPRPDIRIVGIRMKGCARREYEPGAPSPATLLLALTGIAKPRLEDYPGQ